MTCTPPLRSSGTRSSQTRAHRTTSPLRLQFAALLLVLLCPALTPSTVAQQSSLPTDPSALASATLSGFVLDPDGDAIPNAHLSLINGSFHREALTDTTGRYTFAGLPATNLTLTTTATGFGTVVTAIALHPAEQLESLPITLSAASSFSIDALTQVQMADQQIHIEEQQRIFGAIPNFYVVYDWSAAPLNTRQKFHLAWRSIIDPSTLPITAGIAGIQQATDSLHGYHQGAAGYGKRFGAGLADVTVGTFVGGALVPSLLHQDPRYFYMGRGTIAHRALYALSSAFLCRGDNGRWQPNYSSVAGDIASGAVSNLYYPPGSRSGLTSTFANGAIAAAFDGAGNLVQEFLLHHITPRIPPHPSTDPDPSRASNLSRESNKRSADTTP